MRAPTARYATALAAALIVGAWLVSFAPAGAAAAATVPVPASIDATGKQDVTTALNTFLASVAAGATVAFPKGAVYHVEGTVFLDGRNGVTIDGNGATLVAHTDGKAASKATPRRGRRPARLRTHLAIRGSTNVSVRDLKIVGPNSSGRYVPALEGQAAVTVSGSTNIVLDHDSMRDTYGDAVYIVNHSADVTIRSCDVRHAGRQGIAVVGAERVTISECNFESVSRSVVDLEPKGRRGTASSVHIEHNRIGRYGNFVVAGVGVGTEVGDVWVEHNTVSGSRGVSVYVGIPGRIRKGFHVIGNRGTRTSSGYQGALMRFVHFDGIEVRQNHQPVADGTVAVLLVGSCHATVEDNDFPGASQVQRSQGDCGTQLAPTRAPPSQRKAAGKARARRPRNATSDSGGGSDTGTVVLVGVAGLLIGAGVVYSVMRRRAA
ncbi:MAG TPA: right-handed parallel beta-helix repeat-containing protein [Acidimicrobiia bacterium]